MVAFINSKKDKPHRNQALDELMKNSTKVDGVAGKYRDYIAKNTVKWEWHDLLVFDNKFIYEKCNVARQTEPE